MTRNDFDDIAYFADTDPTMRELLDKAEVYWILKGRPEAPLKTIDQMKVDWRSVFMERYNEKDK